MLKDILNELNEDSDNDLTTIGGEDLTIHSIDEDDDFDANVTSDFDLDNNDTI